MADGPFDPETGELIRFPGRLSKRMWLASAESSTRLERDLFAARGIEPPEVT